MNVPNALTITRIVLTPVVLAAYMLNFPAHFLVATILYFIAGMTDFFDGKIARSKNLITNFGKFADPLADKMLTTAVYLALISNGYCNIWILFIILFREFGISSIRLVAAAQGVVIPANMWGKVKTVTQMIAIIAILVFRAAYDITLMLLPSSIAQSADFTAAANGWLFRGGEALIWISTVFAIISGVIYLAQNRHFISKK